MRKKINGKRIKTLCEKHGLKPKVFAAKVGVDVGTVYRWARGEIRGVREEIFRKICLVLGESEAQISGQVPERSTAQQALQNRQMNLSVDAACRNALSLVAGRYRVTRQQIVEAAPLLFFLAAEQSLLERAKRLRVLRDQAGTMLGKVLVNAFALDAEESSIEERDLFGRLGPWWLWAPFYDLIESAAGEEAIADYGVDLKVKGGSALGAFLSGALAESCAAAEPVEWEPGCTPSYRICTEEVRAFFGGDEDAANAILSGEAALHEMPPDIRKSTPAERARWARSAAESYRNAIVAAEQAAEAAQAAKAPLVETFLVNE
jgi:transcriptional regulator with XRE-family HTH domain